jgi:hypothetical protein
MKKITLVILSVLLLCLSIGVCFLIYKTWNIFGFWTLIWTGLISISGTAFLGQLVGSRIEKNGVIIYNPKEWPKFLNMLVSLFIGYYLFTMISNPRISSYDYTFGLSYLILLTGIPILIGIFKLIRDRNDFISIDETYVKYKDNDESGEFKFTDIASVELLGGIKLTFKNDTTLTIKTANMSFNAKDLLNAFNEIKSKLPE